MVQSLSSHLEHVTMITVIYSVWNLKHGSRGSVGEYSKVGEFLKIEPTEPEPEIRNRGIPFLI